MRDFRPEGSIRPIIWQDTKIVRIRKRGGVVVFEYRPCGRGCVWERGPFEARGNHVRCYGPVGGDCFFAPGFVDEAGGWLAADDVEAVGGDDGFYVGPGEDFVSSPGGMVLCADWEDAVSAWDQDERVGLGGSATETAGGVVGFSFTVEG